MLTAGKLFKAGSFCSGLLCQCVCQLCALHHCSIVPAEDWHSTHILCHVTSLTGINGPFYRPVFFCFFFGNNDLKLKEVYFTNVREQYYLLAKTPFGFWRIKKNCETGGNLLDSEAPGQYREKTCHDCCSRALSWHFYAITACLKHPSINFLSPPPLASCSHSHQSAGPSPSCLPRVEAGLQPNSMQTTIHTNSNTLNVAGQSDLLVFEGTSGL